MIKEKLESTHPGFVQLVNPYHPFELKSGEWFFPGYKSVLKIIKETFQKQPENRAVLLYGSPGSGQTSILKQIVKSPHLIGENYIPIYLDGKKYTGLESDNLIFSVYNDIVEKINNQGYSIPRLDYNDRKKAKRTLDLEFAFLTIESIPEDKKVLLIFDDFDSLLQDIGTKSTISNSIKQLKEFGKDWSNYGIIMAGDKSLAYPTGSTTIDRFLDSALKIDLDNVLEKKSIKESITEPVKGQITFEREAVDKILWYSGKNLYYLQLICHYIVEFLNREHRTHCRAADVEKVTLNIISDESDEFREIWEKKFPVEFKLITSAVADENITERKSSVFSFKKNVLLEAILGERISKEIDKLHDLGYIKQIYGRHFTDFPFKIPLYGQWIQTTYPFLKTVVENIELIADKVDFDILMEEIGKAPAGKLNLFNEKLILKIAREWRALTKQLVEKRRTFGKNKIENFLESLSRLLSINIVAGRQPRQDYFILDIKSLNIGIMEEAFCFIQNRPELTADDVHKIERKASAIAEDTQTKLTLFFYFQDSEQLKNLVRKTYLNLVAVEENDLKIILLSNRPQETFRKFILSGLSLQSILPYQTEGPAIATFYGRKDIINRIAGSPGSSFSIVGARKIGKSSLLFKIKDDPPEGTIYILMSLEVEFSRGKSYRRFLQSLEKEIEKIFKKKVEFKKFPFGRSISRLPDVIRGLPRGEDKIVFILDEIDGLLEFDKKNGYKLMSTFRALSQEGSCQFIFAGFKELYNVKRKIENPLYNFSKEIILEPLDDEAALDLTTKPMESIGVHYKNPEDRHLILKYTARHPNLMQFFCQQLVKKVEKHSRIEDRRTILEEDVHEVFDEEYKEYIMDEVYMFFSDLSDINRLILTLLTEDSQKEKRYFSTFEIKDLLAGHGINLSQNEVHLNLRELVVRFILVDEGDENYRFALPVFPAILRRKVDDYFKRKTITEILRR